MRDRKKRNIIITSLCCLLVFMGIGYALLSQTLNINGTAMLTGEWNIYIDSITLSSKSQTANSISSTVNQDKTGASFAVELLKPGDYVEYDVVVKNEGTINAVLRELIPNIESNNMDILLTHSIIQGQILKAKSETKFTLKIRFDERATEIVNGGETSFDIQMVYEQYDGDTSSIVDGVVPVTANDCFTISDTGVITDYDYSCGTYVTIPAVVNGKNVTEISDTAFAVSNAILYFGEAADFPSIVVAKDSDTYISFQAILEQMGGAEATGITLLLEGEELPDTTNLERIEADITETGELALPISKVEYLDLSQATGLENIVEGAFASDGRLQYLNLDGVNFSALENSQGFDTSIFGPLNLKQLTIDTDLYNNIAKDIGIMNLETLRILKGKNSSEISEKIWADETTIKNLIIGEGITAITANYAFSRKEIQTVQLSSTLKEISKGAFSNNNIAKLVIPTSVEVINDYAFETNHALTNLAFENNSRLTYIGSSAFDGNELTSIDFSPIKQKFEIGDFAFRGAQIPELFIDDVILHAGALYSDVQSLELVGDIEFKSTSIDNPPVTNVLISLIIRSDTLEVIPEHVFGFKYDASETTLEFLNKAGTGLNSSIKTIGDSAFWNAKPTTLILPKSLETIGINAFTYANPTTLVMSPVIKSIGYNAFRELTIQNLTLPSTIENLENYVFQSMPSTSTITVNKAKGTFTEGSGWNGNAKVVYNP